MFTINMYHIIVAEPGKLYGTAAGTNGAPTIEQQQIIGDPTIVNSLSKLMAAYPVGLITHRLQNDRWSIP